MELSEIREDLKEIRYYYSRKEIFDNATRRVGESSILEKVKKYNDAVCAAPPKLYDLYVSLYLENNTQDSLACKLGYTFEYVSRLNTKLVTFLQKEFLKKEEIA